MGTDKRQRSNQSTKAIDHLRFLQMLTDGFPEVPQAFGEYSIELLHCQMGTFARLTEAAMDQGRFWQVHKYFSFIEKLRESATSEVENAIDVSFIEYLALSEVTDNRYQAMKRMPNVLRLILQEIDGRGRWT